MFAEYQNIKKINFIYFNTKYVTSMKYMFYNCTNLININLLTFNTNNVTDMSYMFCSCHKLKNLDLSSFNFENVIRMPLMLGSYPELKNINIFSLDKKNLIDKNSSINRSIYINNKFNKSPKNKISIKLIVLGTTTIGKSPLIGRYIYGNYRTEYIGTMGIDMRMKYIEINEHDINIEIYDTSGQERTYSIIKDMYKRMDGFLVGFNLTEKNSIGPINYFIEQIKEKRNKDFPLNLVIFGNKCDRFQDIEIKEEDIEKIKEKYKVKYFNTSAKDGTNVKNLFEYIIKKTLKNKKLLNEIGLPEDIPFEEINIIEKPQKIEIKKINKKKKKK